MTRTPEQKHELHKSCMGIDCDWRNKCDIFERPRAQIHFNPPETGAFCHSYVPKFVPYGNRVGDHDND